MRSFGEKYVANFGMRDVVWGIIHAEWNAEKIVKLVYCFVAYFFFFFGINVFDFLYCLQALVMHNKIMK